MKKMRLWAYLMLATLLVSTLIPESANAVATTAAGTQTTTATQTALSSVNSAATMAELGTVMQDFFDQYNLTFSTDCLVDPGFTCTTLTDADLPSTKLLSTRMIEEWSKYPGEWIAWTDLDTVYFVKNYSTAAQGLVSSAPWNNLNMMLYDVGYGSNETYQRHIIHHEFDHYIEYNRSNPPSYNTLDSIWSGYNPSGFTYVGAGSLCDDDMSPPASCFGEHTTPGFVSGYSTYALEEDKAEVYAYLFSTRDYALLQDWISEDPVLLSKMNNYKAMIKSIVPSMDEDYFNRLHGTYATGHPGTGFTTEMTTKELTDSLPSGVLNIFSNKIIIVNGARGATTVYSGGMLKGTGGVGVLDVQTGGHLATGLSPGCLTAGNTTISGSFDVEIGGTTACSGYDQLQVTGSVTLSGATLNTSRWNNFAPSTGQAFTIISNDAADNVSGTFAGLPVSGSTFTVDGYSFSIAYNGGDGNDVVITVTGVPAQSNPATPNTGLQNSMTVPFVAGFIVMGTAGFIGYIARSQIRIRRTGSR